MKLVLPFLYTSTCVLSVYGFKDEKEQLRHARRNLYQFSSMFHYLTDRNPLYYLDYGCWCGRKGSGTPVDGIDQCCKDHDECYTKVQEDHAQEQESSFWQWAFGYFYECKHRNLAVFPYSYERLGGETSPEVVCTDDPIEDPCYRGYCECDKVASKCIGKYPYNWDFYDYQGQC